jgi:hypothetical protein
VATTAQNAHLKTRFLLAFAAHGNVSAAAKTARVARRTVYAWQEHDEHFLAAFREAELMAIDRLEREAHRRAVTGVLEPVYQGGERVGTVRKFSDTLLIFLLKGFKPEKYREKIDVNVSQVVRAYRGVDAERV